TKIAHRARQPGSVSSLKRVLRHETRRRLMDRRYKSASIRSLEEHMIESDRTSRPAPLSTAYAAAARSLGRRLRYMRGQLGISQQELALQVGIHRTYISRLERGTIMPRLSTLVRLAIYLKSM